MCLSSVHSRTQQENTALAIPLQYRLLTELSVLLVKSAEEPSFTLTKQAEGMRTLDLGLEERREKTREISGAKSGGCVLIVKMGPQTHVYKVYPSKYVKHMEFLYVNYISTELRKHL